MFTNAVTTENIRNPQIIFEYFMSKVLFFILFLKRNTDQTSTTAARTAATISRKTTPLKKMLIKYAILNADSFKKFSEQNFLIDFTK